MLNVGTRIKTYGAIIRFPGPKHICKPVILCDDWDQADLRWEDPAFGFERGVACNVTITGKTIISEQGAQWLRAKLEWVKDGEPSEFEPVLVRVDWNGELVLTNNWPGMDLRRIGETKA